MKQAEQMLRQHFITCPGDYKEGEVFVLRQSFSVGELASARLVITALGMYEAELNGVKVGDQMLAPGFTYYPQRLLYQTWDVTGLLQPGQNTLKVYLGQGWYCGRFLCENKTQIYGPMPAVSWLLECTEADGETQQLCSSPEVEQLASPWDYAGEYDGEIYHAGVPETPVGHAIVFAGTVPPRLEPTRLMVKVQEPMPVQAVSRCGDKTILDFGQNFAGFVEIDPAYLAGGSITLRHGELLCPDGGLYTANLRKAKATLVYHAGGETKKYRPRFTYMGFRYVELSGAEYAPGLVTAYALYTSLARTGHFECGHPLVQKLYENQVWGQKSNYVEVPTDCPQRDERMGYTGDGHVFALTGAFNFDTQAFWQNFMEDMRLGQLQAPEGYIGATAPPAEPYQVGQVNMLGWGNAVTLLPELLYWQYGDKGTFAAYYNSIKRFVDCEISHMNGQDLWLGANLGDWLAPGKDMMFQAMNNNPVSNSFIVHDLDVLAALARHLGKTEDAARYGEQARRTRAAYLKAWVDEETGVVAKGYQSAYVMALRFVIPEGELRARVLKAYVQNVRDQGLQTGFFATAKLLPLLVEAGEPGLAYDVLLNEGCPGWLYQIKQGATTTWERWDALRPDGTVNESDVNGGNMVSFNHYSFGSVGEFFYQYTLGIRPLEPGYQKIAVQPWPDRRLGHARGSYRSRAGEIKIAWRYEGERFVLDLQTPAETLVTLPSGVCHTVLAGSHAFSEAAV